jgi:mono/diheme cytochrome c family protein
MVMVWFSWAAQAQMPPAAPPPFPPVLPVSRSAEPRPPALPGAVVASEQPAPTASADALAFDALVKEYEAKTNETTARISFSVTNISAGEVVIREVRPSCGCTVAKLPSTPWHLAPGASGEIQVATDLRGKRGTLNKFLVVDSSAGFKLLRFRISLPVSIGSGGLNQRSQNVMTALADRQAVFKDDCARCHVPRSNQMGEELYDVACGICHEVSTRASMVPDLAAVRHPATRDYWRNWTARGKEGTLMPGFARSGGGPLTEAQINSLVDYLHTRFDGAPGPDGTKRPTR